MINAMQENLTKFKNSQPETLEKLVDSQDVLLIQPRGSEKLEPWVLERQIFQSQQRDG